MKNKNLIPQKVPQALIVRQAQLSNFDAFFKDYLKVLICPEHGCNNCVWCKKINEGKYFDILTFDGKSIKKGDVATIMERLSISGIEEANIRVYVIKNIEYASSKVLNSLLKFIEEPPRGVYALFTTRNYNAIIPTIRSRCSVIYLPQDVADVDTYLNSTILKSTEKVLIKKCFYELDDMKANLDKFILYYDLVKRLRGESRLIFAVDGLNQFRKMTYDDINLFCEIIKHTYPELAIKIINIQDNLYLNTNKSLIYSQIYDLLGAK